MATTGNAPPRAYAAAHFALELDGSKVGLLKSIEGGSIKADVMAYQQGGYLNRWKQVGKPKFEDIKIQTGMAVSAPFLNWVRGFMKGDGVRKSGAVVAADFYYKERARRNFAGAMIKEVTIPKLDGQDKSPAYLGVTLAVEDLAFVAGGGQKIELQATGFDEQKVWTSCNFLLDLDGFKDECKFTTKIDSFTIKQNVLEYHSGGSVMPTKVYSSQVEYPNLVFYIPEANAAAFHTHVMEKTMKGALPTSRGGTLHIQDNSKKDIFSIKFSDVEILGVTPDRMESTSEEIKQVKIECSVEHMEFDSYAGKTQDPEVAGTGDGNVT
ncbi:MAG TPA: phage tail protein [Kofleriaceae bacterium]|nr:phage tail protein [Kofleriaceae bacterium]